MTRVGGGAGGGGGGGGEWYGTATTTTRGTTTPRAQEIAPTYTHVQAYRPYRSGQQRAGGRVLLACQIVSPADDSLIAEKMAAGDSSERTWIDRPVGVGTGRRCNICTPATIVVCIPFQAFVPPLRYSFTPIVGSAEGRQSEVPILLGREMCTAEMWSGEANTNRDGQ